MSAGTNWLAQVSADFSTVRAAWKAAPRPAELYAPPQTYAGATGLIGFPGWPEYEKMKPGARQDEARAKTALTSSWVYADIQAIANEASLSTIEVVERQSSTERDEEIVNHPLERLWEAPNPFMGRSYVTKFWIWNLLLSGRAALFWVPAGNELKEVWPVPSFMITAEAHPTEFISRYRFQSTPDAKPIYIDRKYITFSRLVHPFDLRDGLSPLAAVYDAILADLAMRLWNKNFFSKENAAPTGLISVPKDMLDPDIARVRLEIQEFFGGASNRRVAVARAGDLEWKPFDRSQKDMEFLQGREFSRNEIDRAFGFPEGYWSSTASRANAEGAVARMIENAVWPHLVMLGEDMNAQTVPVWYGEQFRATFADIRPRNRALEQSEFNTYKVVKTVNELRADLKLDPFEDDDPRGMMLLDELAKQAAIAGTPAAELIDAAAPEEEEPDPTSMPPAELPEGDGADMEADDGSNPTDADQLAPEPDALDAEGKAIDRRRWQTKAIKALREGRSAAVAFTPEHLTPEEVASLSEALKAAQTAQDVRAVFDGRADTLIDAVADEAMRWARRVLEEG